MDYEEDIRKYAEGLNQTKIVSVYRNLYISIFLYFSIKTISQGKKEHGITVEEV